MVVAIALPSIVADFGGWADLARVSWIVNAYLLAYVVAMPLAGRGADLWGARRLYVLALLLFVVGSAGGGPLTLRGTGGRIDLAHRRPGGAGIRGGALVPLSMALASHLFIGRSRSVALGLEGARRPTSAWRSVRRMGPGSFSTSALPIPGLDMASWQWIFLRLNVPIGIVTLLLIYVVACGGIETPRVRGTLDLVGVLLCPVALVSGIGSVMVSGATGWTICSSSAAWRWLPPSASAFAWYELRIAVAAGGPAPVRRPRTSAPRTRSSLLTGYTLATAIIGGPVFVNRVLFGSDAEAAHRAHLPDVGDRGRGAGRRPRQRVHRRADRCGGRASSSLPSAGAGRSDGVSRPSSIGWLFDLAIYGVGFGLTVSPTRHGGSRGRRPGRLRGGERHAPDHPHGRHEHRARVADLHRPEPDRRALGADCRPHPAATRSSSRWAGRSSSASTRRHRSPW